jgi:hypothetical protein
MRSEVTGGFDEAAFKTLHRNHRKHLLFRGIGLFGSRFAGFFVDKRFQRRWFFLITDKWHDRTILNLVKVMFA